MCGPKIQCTFSSSQYMFVYASCCIAVVFPQWMDAFSSLRANEEERVEQHKDFLTLAWYTRFFKRGEWAWISAALIPQPADNNSWHVSVCPLHCQLDYTHTRTPMSLTNNSTISNNSFLHWVAWLLSLSAAFPFLGNLSVPHIYSIFWSYLRDMGGGHSRK